MKRILRSPFVAALIGGAVVAVVLLAIGAGGSERVTTVIQQTPLAEPASGSASKGITRAAIYKRAAPGVVLVRAQVERRSPTPFDLFPQQQRGEAQGSGFVIDGKGDILTNAHVIAGATKVSVQLQGNRVVDAKVVGQDRSTDIALLRVDPKGLDLKPLELGTAKGVEVGDPVVAIGNPFGLERTLTQGVISAVQRRIKSPNGFQIEHVLQTDAAINHGNSGGPLIDAAGRVIGINSQIETAGGNDGNVGIGFAIPIDTAKEVIPQLESSGRVDRAYLGILGTTIDRSLSQLNLAAKSGVLVQEVKKGSPADHAGLRGGDTEVTINGSPLTLGGDVIESIDGKPVKTMDDVVHVVAAKKPGDTVELGILRAGRSMKLSVKLGTQPQALVQQ